MILLFLFSLYFWINALFHITSTFDPIGSLSRNEHVWKTGQEFGSRNFHFPTLYLGKLWSWFFWINLKCCLQGGWMGSALGSKNNVVKDTAVGVEVPLLLLLFLLRRPQPLRAELSDNSSFAHFCVFAQIGHEKWVNFFHFQHQNLGPKNNHHA